MTKNLVIYLVRTYQTNKGRRTNIALFMEVGGSYRTGYTFVYG